VAAVQTDEEWNECAIDRYRIFKEDPQSTMAWRIIFEEAAFPPVDADAPTTLQPDAYLFALRIISDILKMEKGLSPRQDWWRRAVVKIWLFSRRQAPSFTAYGAESLNRIRQLDSMLSSIPPTVLESPCGILMVLAQQSIRLFPVRAWWNYQGSLQAVILKMARRRDAVMSLRLEQIAIPDYM